MIHKREWLLLALAQKSSGKTEKELPSYIPLHDIYARLDFVSAYAVQSFFSYDPFYHSRKKIVNENRWFEISFFLSPTAMHRFKMTDSSTLKKIRRIINPEKGFATEHFVHRCALPLDKLFFLEKTQNGLWYVANWKSFFPLINRINPKNVGFLTIITNSIWRVDQWKKGLSKENQPLGVSVCNVSQTILGFFDKKSLSRGRAHR